MGRTSPQPVYRPRPLSPAPICGLPLSQRGQPRVPSSSLPLLISGQRPSVTGICTLNLAHVHVCVCVCTSVRPHPREPVPGEEPGGLGVPQEAATPGLISHSPENLPTILTLLAGQTPPEGQEGLPRRPPAFPSMCSSPTLASSCTGAL